MRGGVRYSVATNLGEVENIREIYVASPKKRRDEKAQKKCDILGLTAVFESFGIWQVAISPAAEVADGP